MTDQSSLNAAEKQLVPISKWEVLAVYKVLAPVYDWTYGQTTKAARNAAIERANRLNGLLLDVGAGTGLALTRFSPQLNVVGIDLSPHMLEQAQVRVDTLKPGNVIGLSQMDAGNMAFADNSFDAATAIFMMTVAPDPKAVLAELGRVVRPGGEIILVNRFSRDDGVRGFFERLFSAFAGRLGWRPLFPMAPFLDVPGLTLTNTRKLPPFGMYTLLGFRKNKIVADKGGGAPKDAEVAPEDHQIAGPA